MKYIQPKDGKKLKKLSIKVPAALAVKIEMLEHKVGDAGFNVDWDEPVVEVLEKLANGVEKELKELVATQGGSTLNQSITSP